MVGTAGGGRRDVGCGCLPVRARVSCVDGALCVDHVVIVDLGALVCVTRWCATRRAFVSGLVRSGGFTVRAP